MKYLFHMSIIVLSCLVYSSADAAPKPIKLVFLTFSDVTPYSEMKTNEIIDDYLLEELLNIPFIHVMERRVIKEALDAERKLVLTDKDMKNIVETNDFATVFAEAENDLNSKRKGDYIPSKQTKIIGQKYQADYILHGTIEYLGKGKNFMMVPLPHFFVSSQNPYLEAHVFIRMIEASTGEIVWTCREKGVSKDGIYKVKGFTFGTGEFSNQLFVEAMKKISKKVVTTLVNDVEKGILKLHSF